ncbi:hypothetical protein J2W45_003175 [Leifsonia shinshuensis]|nr:hypothetical protein [Leifsonia shinshuensis]
MHSTVDELVCGADMVEVRMSDHQHGVVCEEVRKMFTKTRYPKPSIDDEVTVATDDVPDVRPKELVNMRLIDALDADAAPLSSIPGRGDWKEVHFSHAVALSPCATFRGELVD